MEFIDKDNWMKVFTEKLKVKAFEQFSILLCDPMNPSCDLQQKQELYNILFVNHKSPNFWESYISSCERLYPEKKLQLQRLLNKAIETIDEKEHKDSDAYINIHIQVAAIKSDPKESCKYFANLWKRDIGRKDAQLYLRWADYESTVKGVSSCIDILQKGLLCKAEPRSLIKSRLVSIKDNLQASKYDTVKEDDKIVNPDKTKITRNAKSMSLDSLDGKPIDILIPKSVAMNPEKETASAMTDDSILFHPVGNKDMADVTVKMDPFKKIASLSGKADYDIKLTQNGNDTISLKHSSLYPDLDVNSYYKNADDSDDESTVLNKTSKLPPLNQFIDVKKADGSACSKPSKGVRFSETVSSVRDETAPGKRKREINNSPVKRQKKDNVEITRIQQATTYSSSSGGLKADPIAQSIESSVPFSMEDIGKRIIVINHKKYIKLAVLGKGGSCVVYQVVSEDFQHIFAYKRVDIKTNGGNNSNQDDSEGDDLFNSYVNEINLLKKLKGSRHIIELIDYEINREEMYISIIMEAGDTDLAKVLNQRYKDLESKSQESAKAIKASSSYMSSFFLRLVWQEMLEAVDYIHQHRIVHGDLKPANFVFVRGHLKLIDFGIAKAISNDTTNIYRESQVGTVNYMAPEAISPAVCLQPDERMNEEGKDSNRYMKLGRASDVWSLGCILYQIVYGRPPFAQLNTIQKLHAIPNEKYEIQYPSLNDHDPCAIETIKLCLQRDPKRRPCISSTDSHIAGLLQHQFLNPSALSSSSQNIDKVVEIVMEKLKNLEKDSVREQVISAIDSERWSDVNINRESCQSRDSISTDSNTDSVTITTKILNPNSDQLSSSDDQSNNVIVMSKGVRSDSQPRLGGINQEDKENVDINIHRQTEAIMAMSKIDRVRSYPRVVTATPKMTPAPLVTLPTTLKDQIIRRSLSLQSVQSSSRALRWMKPKEESPVKEDLRSVIERRIGLIRQFTEPDQDNSTCHDFTEGTSFY